MATAPQKKAEAPEDEKATKVDENVAPAAVEAIKTEWEQGFRGTEADPTPNDHYTVAGVTDPARSVPEEFKIRTGVVVLPDPDYGQKK